MNKKFYPEPDNNTNFKELEESVLEFWNENKIFEKSIQNGDDDFVFFDGPPFANGLPHYGHLLAGYIKDTVARYRTMRGKRVMRKFGWDC
ncbi:MAG: class I tRNA ligase family protein, partial [Rickettsiales bacterium]|nr:class I tRNA ligase family protein [Rickettsiales bacterium]